MRLIVFFIFLAHIGSAQYDHMVVDGELKVRSHDTWGTLFSIDGTAVQNGRTWWIMSLGGNAGEGQGKFSIKDGTSQQSRLTIDSAGLVGIGTTSPRAN